MNWKVLRTIVVAVTFLLALVIFSVITNQTNEDLTTSMPDATLPIVSFEVDGMQLEQLHGYVEPMDVAGMRDGIVPVRSDRSLDIIVDTYGQKIKKLHYEIRSLEGERLVADGDLEELVQEGSQVRTTLTVQNILLEQTEYALVLWTEDDSGQMCYFYTRVMQTDEEKVAEAAEFVRKFHEYSFREDADEFIPAYMDPATGDATTLNYVDLTCTLRQITWADFQGEILGKEILSFKEIQGGNSALTLKYMLTSVNDEGETEYYNVEEYYRLRPTEQKMYVMNFERRMNQIFRGDQSFISDATSIVLGIRDSDVEYLTNEAGNRVCFVQEGDLWCYYVGDNTMVQVFSFRDAEGQDVRENWGEHDIRLVRIDEAGSIDFMVYGYMNRGIHEGECGVGVYRYDGVAHTVQEEAFIRYDRSYEMLRAEMGQLMYENEAGRLYMMLNETIYVIDLASGKAEPLVENVKEDYVAVSDTNQFIAWGEGPDENQYHSIHVMDLKMETESVITEEGSFVRPLAFYGEDLVYGAADTDAVQADAAGHYTFPMSFLKIVNLQEGEPQVRKEYRKEQRFVDHIVIENGAIQVSLLQYTDGQYCSGGVDSIVSNHEEDTQALEVSTIADPIRQTEVVLKQSATLLSSRTKMIVSKSVIRTEEKDITLERTADEDAYYVYRGGKIIKSTDDVKEAIHAAYSARGIVVDQQQTYVWKWDKKDYVNAFSGVKPSAADKDENGILLCVSGMLAYNGREVHVGEYHQAGETPIEILEKILEDATVMDLSGCAVEELLYYVSCGNPVLGLTGTDRAVLIIGYSAGNIVVYDPKEGNTSTVSTSDAAELFAGAGDIFLTYR